MTPSQEAAEIARRIVREFRPEGWPAKEEEVARLIDRHYTERLDTEMRKAAQQATAEILGYKDWEDATDYRTTGAQDRKRDETFEIVLAALKRT